MRSNRLKRMCGVVFVSLMALLSACGGNNAVPMNDEFAGNSGENSTHINTDNTEHNNPNTTTSSKQDTGNYQNGTYTINAQYGPVGDDNIDVTLTVSNQNIASVQVSGHPTSSISKKHQNDFINAIDGVVVGKPLRGLKLDVVAGASWTTQAFNKALDVARREASIE